MIEHSPYELEQLSRAADFEARATKAILADPTEIEDLIDLADEADSFMRGSQKLVTERYARLFSQLDGVIAVTLDNRGKV